MAVLFLPCCQIGQEPPDIFFIADKIVVNDEDRATPTKLQKRIKLGNNLLIALGARNTPIDFDDVAELTIERTATGVLHRHRAVSFEVCELKVSNGSKRKWRPLNRFIGTPGTSLA